MGGKIKNLLGNTYGRLSVISFYGLGPDNDRGARWTCRCQCGNIIVVRSVNLEHGNTNSCGCLRSESTKTRLTTHGDTKTIEYKTWFGMLERCRNPKIVEYKHYGGRGINVCDRWLKYENFLADMGRRPKGRTIDRINNNGNYEPLNCKWSTMSEQQNNKRNNHLIEYAGEKMNMRQWCEKLNLNYKAIQGRLNKKWSIERTFSTPASPFVGCNGKSAKYHTPLIL